MSSLRIKDDLNFFFFHWFEYYEFKCTRNPNPRKHVVVYSRVKGKSVRTPPNIKKKNKRKDNWKGLDWKSIKIMLD